VGAEDYGVLSLACQLYADVDLVHRVPRTCFTPRPKVDSVVVRLRCHEVPATDGVPPLQVMRIIRAAFAQRRKTLRNALARSGALGVPAEQVSAALEAAGIAPQRRPQTLSLQEYLALAKALPMLS